MTENQKNRLATIISGLAASGNYTYLKSTDTSWAPALRSSPWDKESELIRYDIIEDALTILQELEKTEL